MNGQKVDAAPEIEDHHVFEKAGSDGAEGEAFSNVLVSDEGVLAVDVSVEVHTGGNTLVNDVVLQNFWTGGAITLVAGTISTSTQSSRSTRFGTRTPSRRQSILPLPRRPPTNSST